MKQKLLILLLSLFCLLSVFASPDSKNDLQERFHNEQSSAVSISYYNNRLIIENAPINSSVEIFSMLGVSIFNASTSEPKQYFTVDLKKGYYIVRVNDFTKKISVK
jgi:hypothetical protein